MKSNKYSDILTRDRLLLSNSSSNKEVFEKLTNYGYTPERINEGMILLYEVENLFTIQQQEYEIYQETSEKFKKSKLIFQKKYMLTLKLLRLAMKGNVLLKKRFNLNDRRKEAYMEWKNQAMSFYKQLLSSSEALVLLSTFNIKKEQLLREKQELEKLDQLLKDRDSKKHNAENATLIRNRKFNELQQWMTTYRSLIKLLFGDNPETLKTIL